MRKSTLPSFKYNGFHIFLRADEIIEINFSQGFYGEIEDARFIVNNIKKISNNKKHSLLVVYADDNLFSNEARDFVSKHDYTKADALVGNSLALRLVGNFYLKINKPVRPTKLFSDKAAAIEWLQGF